MECDWILFTKLFVIPVTLGGLIGQIVIQAVGGWLGGD